MEEPNILIKTALNEAVQKVNEGLSPTSALKKVANDLDLNPNYIQRVGEALNVALHYKHFKTAADRSTEFEIADIPTAVSDVFNFNEKSAAEKTAEQFPDSDSHEHVFNYNRMLSNPTYKQAFLEISGASETHESYPTTFNTIYEKSANYINKLTKAAEAAEVSQTETLLELNEKFSALCDEFKRAEGYRTPFEEFESQVYAKHGEAALPYIDLLHKTACVLEERGVHDGGYMMFNTCKEAQLFDGLMKAAEAMVASEKAAMEITENLAYEAAFLKEARIMLGKAAAPKSQEEKEEQAHERSESAEEEKAEESDADETESDPVLQAIKKKASDTAYSVTAAYSEDPVADQVMEKEAFFGQLITFGNLISHGGEALSGLTHPPVTEAFAHQFKTNPNATAKKPNLTLENMERKLLLQELMLTDPILSKVNPVKVARAFEQILRLSPEISKEKEVVRAELRAMVASQALSKYDADLMTKMDLGMLKRRVATQEFNKGITEHFKF